MTGNSFIEAYRLGLKAKINELVYATGSGSASDWADYQKRVGEIRGLESASMLIDDLVKRFIDEEEID